MLYQIQTILIKIKLSIHQLFTHNTPQEQQASSNTPFISCRFQGCSLEDFVANTTIHTYLFSFVMFKILANYEGGHKICIFLQCSKLNYQKIIADTITLQFTLNDNNN